jgi:hypothetical protein
MRTPQQIKNMKPGMQALRSQVEEFVAGVQEELGMLDELRYEWRRLQTFVEWPLERPRPAELAKAGFFFAPSPEEPDRCAHFCSDKFFSSWEPDDDPWDVLRTNCPESPFVHGLSDNVPLPSAYVPRGKQQHAMDADSDEDDNDTSAGAVRRGPGSGVPDAAGAKGGKGANLTNYLAHAINKVASTAGAATSAHASMGAAAVAAGGRAGGYNADNVSLGSDGEVAAKVKVRKGKKGGAGAVGSSKSKNGMYIIFTEHKLIMYTHTYTLHSNMYITH